MCVCVCVSVLFSFFCLYGSSIYVILRGCLILSYAMEQPDVKDLRDSAENSSGELIVSALRFVLVSRCCFLFCL